MFFVGNCAKHDHKYKVTKAKKYTSKSAAIVDALKRKKQRRIRELKVNMVIIIHFFFFSEKLNTCTYLAK